MSLDDRKVFLSHASGDSAFVIQVAAYLKQHFREVFFYEDSEFENIGPIMARYEAALHNADIFIGFLGATLRDAAHQQSELRQLIQLLRKPSSTLTPILIALPGFGEFPMGLNDLASFSRLAAPQGLSEEPSPYGCAFKICHDILHVAWRDPGGLPVSIFDYEKHLIDFFRKMYDLGQKVYEASDDEAQREERSRMRQILLRGCPPSWPQVVDLSSRSWLKESVRKNGLAPSEIGEFRPRAARVLAVARVGDHGEFAFPEAGPREKLLHPIASNRPLKVGIVVAGGIAPGINAVIDGIVQRHWKYTRGEHRNVTNWLEIRGYINGFHAFVDNRGATWRRVVPDGKAAANNAGALATAEHAHEGGSMLGTYRDERYLDRDLRSGLVGQLVGSHL